MSARLANHRLSVRFRVAACSAAKLLPEHQGCSVLAVVADRSGHFFYKVLVLDGCSNEGDYLRGYGISVGFPDLCPQPRAPSAAAGSGGPSRAETSSPLRNLS